MFGWSAAALAAPALVPIATLGTDRWRAPAPIEAVAVSGATVYAATSGSLLTWDATTGRPRPLGPVCGAGGGLYPGGSLRLAPAGDRLAIACGEVRVRALATGAGWQTKGLTGRPSMVFSADGSKLYLVSQTVTAEDTVGPLHFRAYGAADGRLLLDEVARWHALLAVPDGGFVALGADEETLVGLAPDLSERWTRPRPPSTPAWYAVRGWVCLGGYREWSCLSAADGAPGPRFPAAGDIERTGEAADGLWFGSEPGEVRRWVPGSEPVPIPHDPPGEAWVAWSDGAIRWEHTPRIVRLKPDGGRVEPEEEWSRPDALALDPQGRSLALVDRDGRLFAGPIHGPLTLLAGAWEPWSLAIGPGGAWLLGAQVDERVPVLIAAGRTLPVTWADHEVRSVEAVVGTDGALWAAVGDLEQTSWGRIDPATGAFRPIAPMQCLSDVTWTDGKSALGWCSGSARLFDAATGETRGDSVYLEHCGPGFAEGALVACRDTDEGQQLGAFPVTPGTIRTGPPGAPWLAELPEGLEVHRGGTLVGRIEPRPDGDPAFSADGRTLAVPRPDGTVAVFALP